MNLEIWVPALRTCCRGPTASGAATYLQVPFVLKKYGCDQFRRARVERKPCSEHAFVRASPEDNFQFIDLLQVKP
jgi:hypothetical protein